MTFSVFDGRVTEQIGSLLRFCLANFELNHHNAFRLHFMVLSPAGMHLTSAELGRGDALEHFQIQRGAVVAAAKQQLMWPVL
jgi:hypothetical protein